ncbi:MAG: hypothetical protein JEZ11_07950 [Desulfobacterales bacterium]|nr:hypothetical protein [Desulfobacterales bacterium]
MNQTAAQSIIGRETRTSRFPRPYGTDTLKNNPPKSRRITGAVPLASVGQAVRFFLTPEDTTAALGKKRHTVSTEDRFPWLGRLKALFWIAAAIGLSLGISFP